MEIWDLYNERRERTGRSHIRGDTIPEGFYHLVVHVWIKNSKGEYLLSKRSENRPTFPLLWECVGGSVLQGEDSLAGALRETREEVGLPLLPEDGTLIRSGIRNEVNGVRFSDILDVWLFHYDGSVDLKDATTDEVAQVRWMNKEQIRSLCERGELVPTLGYFFDTDGM